MVKDAKTQVTRIRALGQLHRGDEIEARLKVAHDYDDVVIHRGIVRETAPGIGVVWITDRQSGLRKAIDTDECTLWRVA